MDNTFVHTTLNYVQVDTTNKNSLIIFTASAIPRIVKQIFWLERSSCDQRSNLAIGIFSCSYRCC